jgi:hypothetical protein
VLVLDREEREREVAVEGERTVLLDRQRPVLVHGRVDADLGERIGLAAPAAGE